MSYFQICFAEVYCVFCVALCGCECIILWNLLSHGHKYMCGKGIEPDLFLFSFLFYMQNGAIGEAIRIWKNNLDKEFLGVEECPICYSIIHTTNHSLPRLACKTCKHKFHSACLYKWFSTSHKSTCPLCQTPFWYACLWEMFDQNAYRLYLAPASGL